MKKNQLRIDYDDNAIDIIEAVSYLLQDYGLTLEFDGLPHDGFEIVELIELEEQSDA